MFIPKNITGALQSWEYYPGAAGTYKAGQIVNVSAGVVTPLASASTTTPGYVCMADITVEAGGILPVSRIKKDEIYVTELSAAADSAKAGSKLQVSAGGLAVDAASAGTFEVTYIADTAAGAEVHGRFC